MKRKPLIIGITGGSGTGKTSFIRSLLERFQENELCLISQDDFYKPREEQKPDLKGIKNYDRPKSIDKATFRKTIETVMKGKIVRQKEYTFNNSKAVAKEIEFKPAPIILVEGLYVFHYKKIADLLDIKVFLEARDDLKVIRRIRRDRVERNYPLEDVLYRYQNHVTPSYLRYTLPYKGEADIVINNNYHYERGLDILEGFIKQRLLDYTSK